MELYNIIEIIEKNLDKVSLFNLAKELYANYNTFNSNDKNKQIIMNILFNGQVSYQISNLDSRKICNTLINKYYHNEITIKSNFINKVLIKKNNHVTIFELNSGTSRVDLCKINGSSTAFEIKTDLDNFNRLDKQINDYMRIFEKTFIICSNYKYDEISKLIPIDCGIYTYRITKNGSYIFKLMKEANDSSVINPKTQLSLLTKLELAKYFNIYGKTNSINQIICNFSDTEINNLFKLCLKEKYKNQWNFIQMNYSNILEIDYQWFFKNNIIPSLIYK